MEVPADVLLVPHPGDQFVLSHMAMNDSSDSTLTSPISPPGGDGVVHHLTSGLLRDESWVLPLLAVTAVNAIAIVAFEVYIIIQAVRGTPSRRHLFLGQCLLFGLLLCSLSGLPLALTPSEMSCAAFRLAVTISPALVFGTLLVKTVFLISLNSGVYLPAHYQGLLLFFVVLVQVSISVQWLAVSPALVVPHTTEGVTVLCCSAPYRHILLCLLYVVLLMISVTILAIKCRGYRENYREACYIGGSMGVVIPLWLAWSFTGLVLPYHLQLVCLGFGIIGTATIIFLVMFIPKGRQLAAVGKDGLYSQDREERLSTVSDARYSPSFFLFKPIKPVKEVPRTSNSVYKSPPSGMFGYGILPPHNSLSHSPSSFTPPNRMNPSQPLYSVIRPKNSKQSTSAFNHTSPILHNHTTKILGTTKGYQSHPRLLYHRRPLTPAYWPRIHLTHPYFKHHLSRREDDSYFSRYQLYQ